MRCRERGPITTQDRQNSDLRDRIPHYSIHRWQAPSSSSGVYRPKPGLVPKSHLDALHDLVCTTWATRDFAKRDPFLIVFSSRAREVRGSICPRKSSARPPDARGACLALTPTAKSLRSGSAGSTSQFLSDRQDAPILVRLELELILTHMAQKPMLRVEVGARALIVRSVSREEAHGRARVCEAPG